MTDDLPSWVHDPVWLDGDNFITWVRWQPEGPDAPPYMALWYHRPKQPTQHLDALQGWCFGSFGWRNPDPERLTGQATWDLVSWEPFTVSPSLLCLDCGAHGFIREGKWLPV